MSRFYYKTRQVLQNEPFLLQNTAQHYPLYLQIIMVVMLLFSRVKDLQLVIFGISLLLIIIMEGM